jgi:hypothetical protein
MQIWAGQSSRPSISARYYTCSPTSCHSPPSHQRRLDHIYTIKVLPAPRAAPARRALRAAGAARARTLQPDCRTPHKLPTPHLNPFWRAGGLFGPSASLTIPPRGTGQAAALCATAERKALHPPPVPPSYTYKHWQARSAYLSALITASPTLPHRYWPAPGAGLQIPLASMYSSSLQLDSTLEG